MKSWWFKSFIDHTVMSQDYLLISINIMSLHPNTPMELDINILKRHIGMYIHRLKDIQICHKINSLKYWELL